MHDIIWALQLIPNSNFHSIVICLSDTDYFVLRAIYRGISLIHGLKFGVFPGVDPWCWVLAQSKDPRLMSRKIIFEIFQCMWPWYLNVTDGQMDGQTTCHSNTALCIASHGNEMLQVVQSITLWCHTAATDTEWDNRNIYSVYVDDLAAGSEASCADDIAANDIVSYTVLLWGQVPMSLDESWHHAIHPCQFKHTYNVSSQKWIRNMTSN